MTIKWALAACFATLCGCQGGGKSGPPIQSASEFNPAGLYDSKAVLVYGGTEVEVSIEMAKEASGLVKFILVAHGQPFETETYQATDSSFALVGVDDAFEPPLTLLKFPMRIGDKWEWKGHLKNGSVTHRAEAAIRTSRERLFFAKGGDVDTVRTDVLLQLDSGTQTPAERKLSFWFVRGRGIVKREIGTATIREPVGATDRSPKPSTPKADSGKTEGPA